MTAYTSALKNYAVRTSKAVCVLAEKLYAKKGGNLTLVSLARAGIPIGVLLKRYLEQKYHTSLRHYAISIIRGRGIDRNAVDYILSRHSAATVQFIDGWIGKGAILTQLRTALQDYPELDAALGVVSDPANMTDLCGTHEDILIPSSCLNATVTGLISRTFLRNDIIGPSDFHGAAYYPDLSSEDLSQAFLDSIQQHFDYDSKADDMEPPLKFRGMDTVQDIAARYGVGDTNYIKPGIGETTRVLLRRIPWRVLINEGYTDSEELRHIFQLAAEKGVPCEISQVDMGNYKVCGIIKSLSDL